MSSKISQHYIEKKHLRTSWVKKIFFLKKYIFFECWKFPTSNPFKPKHSHGPCKSHTHSLGSQIISSHMCSKISQHYIEKKHFRTSWVKKIILFFIFFFECWKFPTSNPFKPKYSHWPGRSYTHSLGSQIISSHMCPKISQHYIENKHFRTPWVKKIILFVYIFFECWKFPTSNPFKPKHSHGPCRSHTHSLGS